MYEFPWQKRIASAHTGWRYSCAGRTQTWRSVALFFSRNLTKIAHINPPVSFGTNVSRLQCLNVEVDLEKSTLRGATKFWLRQLPISHGRGDTTYPSEIALHCRQCNITSTKVCIVILHGVEAWLAFWLGCRKGRHARCRSERGQSGTWGGTSLVESNPEILAPLCSCTLPLLPSEVPYRV